MYIEYICIDACHLRGPFGGVLMCATTLDPNKNMLVLAQAILPTENLEHWDYFLYHLNACGMGNNIKFIMSDRDKGLMAGVNRNFPRIPHGKCLRHLAENFKKKFSAEATCHVEHMARCYTIEDFNNIYEKIGAMPRGDEMINWIKDAEPLLWCRAYFPTPRFDVTTSNSVEIFYSVLNKVRHLPPLDLFLYIEEYVLVKAHYRWKRACKMETTVTTAVFNQLQKDSGNATRYRCDDTSEVAGVVTSTHKGITKRYCVDIALMTCSCGRYQERLIPCSHAVALLTKRFNCQPEMYCGDVHSVAKLKQIYNQAATHTSKPTTITDLHDLETIPIAPPKREVRRGRKPTRRIESQSKSKRKAADTILCPFCNQPGHNRRTCPSLRDASTI
jgi:hypothetical protein